LQDLLKYPVKIIAIYSSSVTGI